MTITTVLFDLDGTIIDTNELIITSFLHALKDIALLEPISREHVIPLMGQPLDQQMRFLSKTEAVDDLISAYRAFMVEQHDEMVAEFPHVKSVMEQLHLHGIKMGVVTTKRRMMTELGLQRSGLIDYLDAIITLDDVENPKPHPEPVLKAVEALGADPLTTAMVGDSLVDIEAANRAGVISIGVGWSLKGEAALRAANPAIVIHDMRELLALTGAGSDAD